MSTWSLSDYRYNSPYFQHNYPKEHRNPNYHWGYDELPTYANMPLPIYEQQMRLEQRDVPARIVCDCGNNVPILRYEGVICHKCNKNWSKFIGDKSSTEHDADDAKYHKERIGKENFVNLTAENSLFMVLCFIFLIFVSCVYVHIATLKAEIDVLKHRNSFNSGP